MSVGVNFRVYEIFPFLSHSKYTAWATLRRNKKPGWKEEEDKLDLKDKDESSDENPLAFNPRDGAEGKKPGILVWVLLFLK